MRTIFCALFFCICLRAIAEERTEQWYLDRVKDHLNASSPLFRVGSLKVFKPLNAEWTLVDVQGFIGGVKFRVMISKDGTIVDATRQQVATTLQVSVVKIENEKSLREFFAKVAELTDISGHTEIVNKPDDIVLKDEDLRAMVRPLWTFKTEEPSDIVYVFYTFNELGGELCRHKYTVRNGELRECQICNVAWHVGRYSVVH